MQLKPTTTDLSTLCANISSRHLHLYCSLKLRNLSTSHSTLLYVVFFSFGISNIRSLCNNIQESVNNNTFNNYRMQITIVTPFVSFREKYFVATFEKVIFPHWVLSIHIIGIINFIVNYFVLKLFLNRWLTIEQICVHFKLHFLLSIYHINFFLPPYEYSQGISHHSTLLERETRTNLIAVILPNKPTKIH